MGSFQCEHCRCLVHAADSVSFFAQTRRRLPPHNCTHNKTIRPQSTECATVRATRRPSTMRSCNRRNQTCSRRYYTRRHTRHCPTNSHHTTRTRTYINSENVTNQCISLLLCKRRRNQSRRLGTPAHDTLHHTCHRQPTCPHNLAHNSNNLLHHSTIRHVIYNLF